MEAGTLSGTKHSSPSQFMSWMGVPRDAYTRTPTAFELAMFRTFVKNEQFPSDTHATAADTVAQG
uniref:Uncharacterized protein n=1 Tax=Anguilla anguilla TaxID=7936 RepID=A0A0E9RK77_ANGAN